MRIVALISSGPKRAVTYGVVLLGIIVIVFTMRMYTTRIQAQIAAVQEEMSPFVLPERVTGSDISSLRAQRYALETRFDPFIALAGSDTEGIRKALIPLRNEAAEVLGSYSAAERAQIDPVLFPGTFLSLLPDLEDLRRSVIAAPRPKTVRLYDTQLQKTIRAYRNDIARYREVLASLPASNQDATIHYLAGTTSVTLIKGKLDTLDKRASALETKRAQRYACFLGASDACTPLSESFAAFTKAPSLHPATRPPTSLARSLIYRDVVREAFSQMLGDVETHGIVVKLPRSECLSGTPASYYYFFQSREEEQILSSTATPLNDLYFYDLTATVNGQKSPPAYLKELYAEGLRYNFQNIGNLYFCPNSGHVLADVATTVSLHERLKRTPLFADNVEQFPDLARLETGFAGSDIPDEADMDAFMAALISQLGTTGERSLAAQIGQNKVLEMEELITEWRNRSSHFEQSLTAAHHINRLSKGLIALSKQPVYSFLLTRVYSSVFFMPFNQSLVGEPVLFLDEINARPSLKNFHLIPYSTGLWDPLDLDQTYAELRREQRIVDTVLQVAR